MPTGPGPVSLRNLFAQLVTPQNRLEVHQALTDYDAAEHADRAARTAQLASVQICVGVAVALFPYTPGLVDSCRRESNPGWLCGARAATLIAATGAVVVGLVTGYGLITSRNWLCAYREGIALGLRRGASATVDTAGRALAAYAVATDNDRRRVREDLWQASAVGP